MQLRAADFRTLKRHKCRAPTIFDVRALQRSNDHLHALDPEPFRWTTPDYDWEKEEECLKKLGAPKALPKQRTIFLNR